MRFFCAVVLPPHAGGAATLRKVVRGVGAGLGRKCQLRVLVYDAGRMCRRLLAEFRY